MIGAWHGRPAREMTRKMRVLHIMEKQLLPALAVLLFCLLYTAAIAAQTKSHLTSVSPDKTKGEVHRLGFGKRVKVRLHSGTKVRGRITGLSDDQFVVTDSKSGVTTKVAYAEVADIRKQRGMPGVLKAAFYGFGVTAAVVGSLGTMVMAIPD
jgi:hypothetical protein